ncbi:MAG: hypothetical protein QXF31_05440 [Candidatus Bathyarchaeia archaeon]
MIPSNKIGVAFIIPGALALIFSILRDSTTLAFIGLGLTFWGALFFFIKAERHVHESLLDSTAISIYTTADRAIRDLKIGSNSYYIPPYPKDVYIPEHLKGLKEATVFISDSESMPPIEVIAQRKFLLENPRGICVSPPGLGILDQIEKEMGKDLSSIQLSDLSESLPPIIVENLQLAKEIEMRHEGNQVHVIMVNPAYRSLYASGDLKSVHFLGCPLVSAIACAIAKSTGKIVTIQKIDISQEDQAVKVLYRIVET